MCPVPSIEVSNCHRSPNSAIGENVGEYGGSVNDIEGLFLSNGLSMDGLIANAQNLPSRPFEAGTESE